ncbi:MAG: alpha/beta fold hydrolase [Acidimicrobiia bacterium]
MDEQVDGVERTGEPGVAVGGAAPTSHSYFSQRLRLHYLDWGNAGAPPLLLVHGNRDHCHNWDWVAARLRDEYHIVAPDLRGHGDSQWSTGSTYTSAEYVYDIAQLIHQRGMAPLRIVAHSLGGSVALKYAGAFPENVERLIVIEGTGPPRVDPALRPTPPDRMRSWIEAGRALAGRTPRRYPSLDAAFHRMQEANPHLSPEQARHLTIHGSNENEDGTYSWKFDNHVHVGTPFDLGPEETRRLWANIACPVLLVTGSESWQRRHVEDDDLVGEFRDARHVVIDDAGHWVHHDQLDRFVALVRDFLA